MKPSRRRTALSTVSTLSAWLIWAGSANAAFSAEITKPDGNTERRDPPADVSSNAAKPAEPDGRTRTDEPRDDESDLPTGAEVLDRFVEATGGADAYAEIHNRVSEGRLEFIGMGIRAQVQVYQAAPTLHYAYRDIDGLGPVEEGCDGETVWSNSMTQGPELARGAVRAYKLRAYRLNADLLWRDLYERVDCTGIETLGEIPCYRVEKYPPAGQPETSWYSRQSGLLVRTDVIAPTSMGDIPIRTLYQDYRQVGELLVPHVEIVTTMGREQRMEYERIAFNTEIAPDRFTAPPDIQLLVERYRAKAPLQAAAEGDDESVLVTPDVVAPDEVANVDTNGVASR